MRAELSGATTGQFAGRRWFGSSELTGTYNWKSFVLQPANGAYVLQEHDGAYVDSLGTPQGTYDFATRRASAGLKVSYPIAWSSALTFSPSIGLFGDYYFSSNDAASLAGLKLFPCCRDGQGGQQQVSP
jgi:hypothetical protein